MSIDGLTAEIESAVQQPHAEALSDLACRYLAGDFYSPRTLALETVCGIRDDRERDWLARTAAANIEKARQCHAATAE